MTPAQPAPLEKCQCGVGHPFMQYEGDNRRLQCPRCGTSTPWLPDEAEATAYWNKAIGSVTRTAQPAPDHEAAKLWASSRVSMPSPSGPNETQRDDNLARSYLARCAEVEALTAEVARIMADNHRLREERAAFKATAARLRKALEVSRRLIVWLRSNRERRELPADFEEVATVVSAALLEAKP